MGDRTLSAGDRSLGSAADTNAAPAHIGYVCRGSLARSADFFVRNGRLSGRTPRSRVTEPPDNLKLRMKPWQPHRKSTMSSEPNRSPEAGRPGAPPQRGLLLNDASEKNWVSIEYFVVALTNKLKASKHLRHFVIGYRTHVPPRNLAHCKLTEGSSHEENETRH